MSELRPVLERFRDQMNPPLDAATELEAIRSLRARRSVKRRVSAAIVASVVAIAGIGVAVRAFDPEDAVVREPASPVFDPRIITSFPVGPRGQVGSIVAGFGSVWATAYGVETGGGPDGAALLRIDPKAGEIADVIPLDGVSTWETGGGGIAVGPDALWVAGYAKVRGDSQSVLYRIDPASLEAEGILLGGAVAAADVAVSEDDVWVTGRHDVATLTHVDPQFGKIDAPEIRVRGETARQVVATDSAVVVRSWEWESNQGPCAVFTSIDPRTVTPIAEEPRDVCAGGEGLGSLFVWDQQVWASTSTGFTQLDPSTASPTGSVVPFAGEDAFPRSSPAVDDSGVWYGAYPGGSGSRPDRLTRFDPASGTIETFELEVGWSAATTLEGTLWALGWDGTVTRIDLFAQEGSVTDIPVEDDVTSPTPDGPASSQLEISCETDGVRVATAIVHPTPEGVRVSVTNPVGARYLEFHLVGSQPWSSIGAPARPDRVFNWHIEPGTWLVACITGPGQDYRDVSTGSFDVVDPAGHWIEPGLDCASPEVELARVYEDVPDDELPAVALAEVTGIVETGVYGGAGYGGGNFKAWRYWGIVLRDGERVASLKVGFDRTITIESCVDSIHWVGP